MTGNNNREEEIWEKKNKYKNGGQWEAGEKKKEILEKYIINIWELKNMFEKERDTAFK